LRSLVLLPLDPPPRFGMEISIVAAVGLVNLDCYSLLTDCDGGKFLPAERRAARSRVKMLLVAKMVAEVRQSLLQSKWIREIAGGRLWTHYHGPRLID
jgi:hypothetical protein